MKNILLIITGVSLNAAAQLLMKKGMMKTGAVSIDLSLLDALPKMFANGFLWMSVICYVMSCLTWMIVLSRTEVSFAYAFTSLGIVIVTIMGCLVFHERLTVFRVSGIVLICAGIVFVSRT
jgi:drug/metabolite transporter (DMT)-like permease